MLELALLLCFSPLLRLMVEVIKLSNEFIVLGDPHTSKSPLVLDIRATQSGNVLASLNMKGCGVMTHNCIHVDAPQCV